VVKTLQKLHTNSSQSFWRLSGQLRRVRSGGRHEAAKRNWATASSGAGFILWFSDSIVMETSNLQGQDPGNE